MACKAPSRSTLLSVAETVPCTLLLARMFRLPWSLNISSTLRISSFLKLIESLPSPSASILATRGTPALTGRPAGTTSGRAGAGGTSSGPRAPAEAGPDDEL